MAIREVGGSTSVGRSEWGFSWTFSVGTFSSFPFPYSGSLGIGGVSEICVEREVGPRHEKGTDCCV